MKKENIMSFLQKNKFPLIGITSAAVLILVACGGGGSSAPSPTGEAPNPPVSTDVTSIEIQYQNGGDAGDQVGISYSEYILGAGVPVKLNVVVTPSAGVFECTSTGSNVAISGGTTNDHSLSLSMDSAVTTANSETLTCTGTTGNKISTSVEIKYHLDSDPVWRYNPYTSIDVFPHDGSLKTAAQEGVNAEECFASNLHVLGAQEAFWKFETYKGSHDTCYGVFNIENNTGRDDMIHMIGVNGDVIGGATPVAFFGRKILGMGDKYTYPLQEGFGNPTAFALGGRPFEYMKLLNLFADYNNFDTGEYYEDCMIVELNMQSLHGFPDKGDTDYTMTSCQVGTNGEIQWNIFINMVKVTTDNES